jgi:hypothetical protein
MVSRVKLVTKTTGKKINEWLVDSFFKGKRQRVIFLKQAHLVKGKRRIDPSFEVVSDPARIEQLKSELPEPHYRVFSDCNGSSMNETLAAMAWAIYYGKDDCPPGMDTDDWPHNLKRAKQLLKENGVSEWDIAAIANAILPPRLKVRGRIKLVRCDWCRFPILFGYRVNGRLVERKRKLPVHFCENACKLQRWRHPKRLG